MATRIRIRSLILALCLASLILGLVWLGWPGYELWRGRRYLAAGNLAKAQEVLEALVKAEPNRPDVRFEYARLLRRRERPHDALAAFQRASELGLPESPVTRRERGLILAGADFGQAEPLLKETLEQDSADPEALAALANGYLHQHRWVEADQILTQWLDLEPENLKLYQRRGEERRENKNYEEAAGDFRTILRQSPEDFTALILLADCLLADAQAAVAEPLLVKCRQMRPDRPEPLVGLAVCAMEKGELDKANSLLKLAHDLDPLFAGGLHEQADLYLFRQRYDLAIPMFAQLLQLDPRDKVAHLKLAQALRHTGDAARAAQHERAYKLLDDQEARRIANERGARIEGGKLVPKDLKTIGPHPPSAQNP